MSKILRITKAVLYICAGILIFLFSESIMPYVAFLVGGVVLAYGLEELVFHIVQRQFPLLAESLIQILLAFLLFLSYGNFEKVCVIWGVWTILREGRELARAVARIRYYRLAVLDIIESVVVIALSVLIVLKPEPFRAHVHVIILGIELILEVLFPLLEELVQRKKEKKQEQQ